MNGVRSKFLYLFFGIFGFMGSCGVMAKIKRVDSFFSKKDLEAAFNEQKLISIGGPFLVFDIGSNECWVPEKKFFEEKRRWRAILKWMGREGEMFKCLTFDVQDDAQGIISAAEICGCFYVEWCYINEKYYRSNDDAFAKDFFEDAKIGGGDISNEQFFPNPPNSPASPIDEVLGEDSEI